MSVKNRVAQLEKKSHGNRAMIVMKKKEESEDEALSRAIQEHGFTPEPDDIVVWLKYF